MSPHSLVIGGTKGLGLAVAKKLAQRGRDVSIVGRTRPSSLPASVKAWQLDLLDLERIPQLLGRVVATKGPISNLVVAHRYRGEAWDEDLHVSVTATRTLIEHAARQMEKGSIVVVTSVASRFVAEEQPLGYHVAKASLAHMVRYYAVRLGAHGIRVNAVAPSAFIKEETRDYFAKRADLRRLYQIISPSGRMIRASEVAEVIVFLCSARASAITGQELVVDRGCQLEIDCRRAPAPPPAPRCIAVPSHP